MYRLAVLISHPIQYHTPIFQALAKNPEINLTVYYCWDFGIKEKKYEPEFGVSYKWDIPLLDGYDYKFLRNISPKPSSKKFWNQINPGIIREIRKNDYDAILVHGYTFLTDWLAFFAAKLRGTPLFIRGVTHILDEKSPAVRIVKKTILPFLFRMCDACLYIGKNNRDYYKFYGVPDKKLYLVPHVVGNDFFRDFYKKLKPKKKELKKKFGFSGDRPVILFAGKLIDKKRPLWALEAYRRIREKYECGLLFAGDGPLRKEVEEKIKKENIPDVRITGFLNQTEMPEAYTAGDILVLPSAYGETWGLVVNEAMNFELPVVISDRVGCGSDLVKEGKNGYIVDSLDSLSEKLAELVKDPRKRDDFGKESGEIIGAWGINECVGGIIKVLEEKGKGK